MLPEIIIWVLRKIGVSRLVSGIYILTLAGFLAYGLTLIVDDISGQFIFSIIIIVFVVNSFFNQRTNQWFSIAITIFVGFLLLFILNSDVHLAVLNDFVKIFQMIASRGILEISLPGYGQLFRELIRGASNSTWIEINEILGWILSNETPASEFMLHYIWGMAAVIIGTWVAHFVIHKRKPVEGISIPGVLLGSGLAYKWESPLILLAYVGISVLLILWNRLMTKESEWDQGQLDFPTSMRLDSFVIGFASGTMLVLAAVIFAFLPLDYSIQRVYAYTEPVVDALSDQLEEIGIIRGKQDRQDRFSSAIPAMPREHLIGMIPDLSQQIVFEAELASNDDLNEVSSPFRYWKVSTYDIYTGNGWKSSDYSMVELDEFIFPSYDNLDNQVLIDQTINTIRADFDRLVYTGYPVMTNSGGTVAERDTNNSGQRDVYTISTKNDQYTVRSVIPVFSEQVLITASREYPEWILDRYLDLPDTIPERVYQMVDDLTTEGMSNYEKAKAIERYLRVFPYSLDITADPDVPDIVDHFLFELRSGYCDYYASAMVVMARTIGIPSRLVIGFVPGVVSDDGNRMIISESDAHSWAELYFPGLGWVPFEPTGGRIELMERGDSSSISALQVEDYTEAFPRSPGYLRLLRRIGFLAFAVLASVLFYSWYRRATTSHEVFFHQIFYRFMRLGRWIGIHPDGTTTPQEYSGNVLTRIHQLSKKSSWIKGNRYTISLGVNMLVDEYSRITYGGEDIFQNRIQQISRLWRRLQFQLLGVIMVYYYHYAFNRIKVFTSQAS